MINFVLLASTNDASVTLAERIAGSEERFARMMTYNARFDFLRIRYRVLAQSPDLARLRQGCTITLSRDGKSMAGRLARYGLALIEVGP